MLDADILGKISRWRSNIKWKYGYERYMTKVSLNGDNITHWSSPRKNINSHIGDLR